MKIKYAGLKLEFDERKKVITLPVYGSDEDGDYEEDLELPCRWEVCGSCDGSGVTTRHIECDGGGFTSSEWAEMCDGDPDFAEDYMSGKYDRPCEECNGRRVAPVIDMEEDDPRWAAINERIEGERQYRAEVEAERRMGA